LALSSEDLALDVLLPLFLLDELLGELVHLLFVIVELYNQVDLLLLKLNHVLFHFLVFNERAVQFVGDLLNLFVLHFELTLFLGNFRFFFLLGLVLGFIELLL
jgi:hypothetical protein